MKARSLAVLRCSPSLTTFLSLHQSQSSNTTFNSRPSSIRKMCAPHLLLTASLPARDDNLPGITLSVGASHACSWKTNGPHPLISCTLHNVCSLVPSPDFLGSFLQPGYCVWIVKGTASPFPSTSGSKWVFISSSPTNHHPLLMLLLDTHSFSGVLYAICKLIVQRRVLLYHSARPPSHPNWCELEWPKLTQHLVVGRFAKPNLHPNF